MPSRAQRIVDAVAAALTVPAMTSVPAARVYRDLVGALQAPLLPAIVIEPGDEPAPARGPIGYVTRSVEVRITVLASTYAAADPSVVESAARLRGAPTLAGLALDVAEGPTVRQRDGDDAGRPYVAVTRVYSYAYRTTEESIE